MLSYCYNDPVNRIDPTGLFWKESRNTFFHTFQHTSGYFVATFIEPTTNNWAIENKKVVAAEVANDSDNPVTFPEDPNDFCPTGLDKAFRPGTSNGSFINWMDPLTNTEVFRWDENPNRSNGPHYHIYGEGHYYPGENIPADYVTMYFAYK